MGKIKVWLSQICPHMELSLLRQHNSDDHTQVPEQLQRFNAIVSPPWITHHMVLTWHHQIYFLPWTAKSRWQIIFGSIIKMHISIVTHLWSYLNTGDSVYSTKVTIWWNNCTEVNSKVQECYLFSFSSNTYNHFHIINYDTLQYSITLTTHCDLTNIEDWCNKKEGSKWMKHTAFRHVMFRCMMMMCGLSSLLYH
jgi:hypothetical protein